MATRFITMFSCLVARWCGVELAQGFGVQAAKGGCSRVSG